MTIMIILLECAANVCKIQAVGQKNNDKNKHFKNLIPEGTGPPQRFEHWDHKWVCPSNF